MKRSERQLRFQIGNRRKSHFGAIGSPKNTQISMELDAVGLLNKPPDRNQLSHKENL